MGKLGLGDHAEGQAGEGLAGHSDIESMLCYATERTTCPDSEGGRTRGAYRGVIVGMLAIVLAAAVLCLALPSAQESDVSLDQVTQACPPPCVPHVFSQREEAELTGSLNKGKMAVPSGNEAVEEAMRAATDANGQIRLASQPSTPT
eukprot:2737061-Rhodomonas_salina.1